MRLIKIAVLISGNGSNLQAIIDEIHAKKIAEVALVISDRKDAYGLKRAQISDVESIYIPKLKIETIEEYHNKLLIQLNKKQIDLVVLAGYLKVVSGDMIEQYKNNILNIHPSLIPSFCGKGYYGIKVHEAVIESKTKITGATVHVVDAGTDTGPIVIQEKLEVHQEDTAETLQKRVLEIEHRILVQAITEKILELERGEGLCREL